jgi:hypothetical protein
MRDDAPPSQPKSGKELPISRNSVCQNGIPLEFIIVTRLAKGRLCRVVLCLHRRGFAGRKNPAKRS